MIEIRRYAPGFTDPVRRTIDDLAADSKADDGVVWVDCQAPAAEDLRALFEVLRINEFVREDLTKGGQRTKLAHYDSHSYVAVYDCALHHDGLRAREIDIVFDFTRKSWV